MSIVSRKGFRLAELRRPVLLTRVCYFSLAIMVMSLYFQRPWFVKFEAAFLGAMNYGFDRLCLVVLWEGAVAAAVVCGVVVSSCLSSFLLFLWDTQIYVIESVYRNLSIPARSNPLQI